MVTNYDVARIFSEIAEALELRGGDPFRVRAYQNAARTILQLDEPLADIRARGELTRCPASAKRWRRRSMKSSTLAICASMMN